MRDVGRRSIKLFGSIASSLWMLEACCGTIATGLLSRSRIRVSKQSRCFLLYAVMRSASAVPVVRNSVGMNSGSGRLSHSLLRVRA